MSRCDETSHCDCVHDAEAAEARVKELENPSDGRCMEISALREHVKSQAERASQLEIELAATRKTVEYWIEQQNHSDREYELEEENARLREALTRIIGDNYIRKVHLEFAKAVLAKDSRQEGQEK